MNLAIKGHPTQGSEVIARLKMLGGMNTFNLNGSETNCYYYINDNNKIYHCLGIDPRNYIYYILEEFLEKFPYKVGDTVLYKPDNTPYFIIKMFWKNDKVLYELSDKINLEACSTSYTIIPDVDVVNLQPYKEETMEDKGNISDGYHTFNELYEYRLLYNASMFNELAKQGLYDVHKSKRHSDGTIPFGDENWFIVQAELPTGQISNHYEMKDWDLFQVPIKEKANQYDGHTPQDVAKRLRDFLSMKKMIEPKFKVGNKIKYINGKNKDGVKEGIILSITNDTYDVAVTNDMGIFVPISEQDEWGLISDKFDISNLKPFDKVLVRDVNDKNWVVNIFGYYRHETKYPFYCSGNINVGFKQCIPYEKNEHLLGTTNDCNEYFKTWN